MSYEHSLAHTKWDCKYHVVFAPKYRRKVFYRQKRYEIGQILRELCKWKGVTVLSAEACPDHIHMMLEIPPKYNISGFMGFSYAFLGGLSRTVFVNRYDRSFDRLCQ